MNITETRNSEPFSIIAKPAGARCNLDCTYCFYLEKNRLYPNSETPTMSGEVLEKYISRYIHSQPGDTVTFAWQGGEPTLLKVDYFQRVVELQQKHADGKTIENAFQTNGLLLDDKWCTLFKEAGFLVGLSIDGPEDLHDAYRINSRGSGSFKLVMRGLEYLKKHQVEFNTLTALHRGNVDDPLRIYHFLKEIGSKYQQFIPIVEQATTSSDTANGLLLVPPSFPGHATVTNWSLTTTQYGDFLINLFDEWVRNDVGRNFIQLFDSTLSLWIGQGAQMCIFQKTCGFALAMEHNGDLYSCDHYVYPDFRLGNIIEDDLSDMACSPQQIQFGRNKVDSLPTKCLTCKVRLACNGGCPKHRTSTSAEGESGLNYFCAAYYRFFTHAAPYMNFMANEIQHKRTPANVMGWARKKDRGFPSL